MSIALVSPTAANMTGSFISYTTPPSFADVHLHPAYKHIKGTTDVRTTQLLHSANVEGFLFVHDNKLVTLYLAQVAFDHASDPQEQHPLVIGALNLLCAEAVPIALSLNDILADTLVMKSRDASSSQHSFSHGKDLTEVFFDTALHPTYALTKISLDKSVTVR